MSIYGINGQVIQTDGLLSSSDIKKALIGAIADGTVNVGSQIGTTIDCNVNSSWEKNAETAYQLMLTAYKENPNSSIPFFISTDQHGRGIEPNRWVNNRDVDGMNMMNLNLGDCVTDAFNMTEINRILERSKQIKNYIAVAGNHEFKYTAEKVRSYEISRTFITTNLERRMNPANCNTFSVVDNLHHVKYIALDEYLVNPTGIDYKHALSTETTDWLISELMNDEYDIVLLKHWFLKLENKGQYIQRDGVKVPDTTAVAFPALSTLVKHRKEKLSGSFIDSNGQAHAYDFSKCKTDLLCALHGHEHLECYGYVGKLLCYCADWLGNNNSCTFGLIDRKYNKLRVWVVDSVKASEEFSMNLTV